LRLCRSSFAQATAQKATAESGKQLLKIKNGFIKFLTACYLQTRGAFNTFKHEKIPTAFARYISDAFQRPIQGSAG
jgi:hypothetical protein